mmetsp:Transcript_107041/g.184633  ORF Transcript_107041/g.184633 Transcript_107041/m.184633 type:complete len:215 (-) Transcript_107041:67-711(-)
MGYYNSSGVEYDYVKKESTIKSRTKSLKQKPNSFWLRLAALPNHKRAFVLLCIFTFCIMNTCQSAISAIIMGAQFCSMEITWTALRSSTVSLFKHGDLRDFECYTTWDQLFSGGWFAGVTTHLWYSMTPTAYVILLHPIWTYGFEIVVGYGFMWMFGHNYAWEYEGYPLVYFDGNITLLYFPLWMVAGYLYNYAPFFGVNDRSAMALSMCSSFL